jgi:hypothetical protein
MSTDLPASLDDDAVIPCPYRTWDFRGVTPLLIKPADVTRLRPLVAPYCVSLRITHCDGSRQQLVVSCGGDWIGSVCRTKDGWVTKDSDRLRPHTVTFPTIKDAVSWLLLEPFRPESASRNTPRIAQKNARKMGLSEAA